MQGALVAALLRQCPQSLRVLAETLILAVGVCLLVLAARVEIILPFTPVPITGQTFGVTLIALLWGGARASLVVLVYLLLGACGLPVFAGGESGLAGPSAGYLIGMLPAAAVMGYLAGTGRAQDFVSAFMVAALGTVIIFGFGIAGLALYLPADRLLTAGVWPFLPGAVAKNALAAAIVALLYRLVANKKKPETVNPESS